MSDPEFQHDLDVRGLRCPEPVMMLHVRIRRMAPGDVVRVTATDPSTARDIPKFCAHLGHALIADVQRQDELIYFIRKKS